MRILCLLVLLVTLGCSRPHEVSRINIGRIVNVEYLHSGYGRSRATVVKTNKSIYQGSTVVIHCRHLNITTGVTAYQVQDSNGSYWFTWEGSKRRYFMSNPI